MSKRGISAIVATVLIILITVAGVAIIWVAIVPMINDGLWGVNTDVGLRIVTSGGYTIWDPDARLVAVQVERGNDEADLVGFDLIFNLGGNSVKHYIEEVLDVNSHQVYYVNLSNYSGELLSIEVAPVFKNGKIGAVTSRVDIGDIGVADIVALIASGIMDALDFVGPNLGFDEGEFEVCVAEVVEDSFDCYNGDVYWFDDCGVMGDLNESCSEGCSGGVCTISFSGDVYYVSVDGDDSNDGSINSPFATVQKARDVIQGSAGNTVYIREGTYYLTETLSFGAQDSGSVGVPNVYMGYPDEDIIIKGSKKIPVNEFTTYSGDILQADLSAYNIDEFYQMFMNGERLIPARYPNYDSADPIGGGYLYVASDTPVLKTQFTYNPGDVDPSGWTNIEDIQVDIFSGPNYWNSIANVELIGGSSVDLSSGISYDIREGNRYYFQNIFEELDSINEWYFDKTSKMLYFYSENPLTGSDDISIPLIDNVISLDNVSHIEFKNINVKESKNNIFLITDSENVMVDNIDISGSKKYGIEISKGKNISVINSEIHHTGGWGIYGYQTVEEQKELINSDYLISGNDIHHTGRIKKGSYGASIYLRKVTGAVISKNHIHNVPGVAIRVGTNDNIIEYNHIHDVNQERQDSGVIKLGGRNWIERGNIIRYNFINGSGGYGMSSVGVWQSPYYTYGIYLDDWASGTHIYGNTIVDSYFASIMIHSGRDNIIENNTIIDSIYDNQMRFQVWDISNSGYDDMWNQLEPILNGTSTYNSTKYLQRYPEITTITEAMPQDEIMSYNKFIGNKIIYPENARWLYREFWLDYSTTEIDNNIIWAGINPILVRTNPPYVYEGDFNHWNGLGFDLNSVDVSDFYEMLELNDDSYKFLINTEHQDKDFVLENDMCDLNDNVVSGSITLKSFESKILLNCFCNNDGICNNRETIGTCSNDCFAGGLVSHWKFDETSGAIAYDSGPGENNGSLQNDSFFVYDLERDYNENTTGYVLSLDGDRDYVDTNSDMIGADAVTVCAWIYPKSWGQGSQAFIVYNGKFLFKIVGSLYNRIIFSSNGINNPYAYGYNGDITLNNWNHVCAERRLSGESNLYVNGVMGRSPNQDTGTPEIGTMNVLIGTRALTLNNFDGLIDDVMIFNRSLNENEVQEIFCSQGGAGC